VKENAIDDAEDDRLGANAEGESKDGDERETAVFAKIAEGVAEIAEEDFQVSLPAGVVDLFFDAFDAAEPKPRTTAGFFWTEACGYVVGNLAFEVELELLVELAFGARPMEQTTKPVHSVHLFVAQCDQRIDAGGPSRGQKAGS
jgi:hypothetical protein